MRGSQRRLRAAVLAIAVSSALIAPSAQSRRADADFLRAAYESYLSLQRSSPYASLKWQSLGPNNISGRATDIAVAERSLCAEPPPPA